MSPWVDGDLLSPTNLNTRSGFDPRAYGALDNGTGNDSPAIQAAHDAMPSSGGVLLLGSHHRIATTVTLSKFVIFQGRGRGVLSGTAPTRLVKASTLNGPAILLTGANAANGSTLQGFQLDGEGGNGGDGIVVGTNYVTIRDVTVNSMGQDGIRIGRDFATNVNLWRLDNCFCRANGRHGFNIDDPSGTPDSNAGTLTHCDASLNGGDGLRLGKTNFNRIYGFTPQANAGIGVHLTANANQHQFFGGDWNESNTGGDLVVDSGATDNLIIAPDLDGSAIASGKLVDNGTRTTILLRGGWRNRIVGWGALGDSSAFPAFSNGDTTPSVKMASFWRTTNSSPTSITNFDDGENIQFLVIKLDNQTTIVHNTSLIRLKGGVNITGVDANAIVQFVRHSAIWYEIARNF